MSNIDRRIVQLSFDNKGFESGVRQTMRSLEQLKTALEFKNSTDGFVKLERAAESLNATLNDMDMDQAFVELDESVNDVKFDGLLSGIASAVSGFLGLGDAAAEANADINFDNGEAELAELNMAADSMDFANVYSAVQSLEDRFSTFGIVGMTVIERLTNAAIDFGLTLVNKVAAPFQQVIGMIQQGGYSRAANIEQAHFMLQGLIGDETEVTAIMANAQESVNDTAYAYDSAAKAAAQFAASGLKSGDQMMTALRGITGVAATTNSEYEDISRIFTTVAGNGRLMGDQLLQLGVRGLNAAAILGNAFGKTESEVRDMVSKGEVSFEMFAQAMDDAFGEHATKANETFDGAMRNIRSALARTGEAFYKPLIEQNSSLVKLINSIRIAINAFNNGIEKNELGEVIRDTETLVEKLSGPLTGAILDVADYAARMISAFDMQAVAGGLGHLVDVAVPIAETITNAFLNVFPPPDESGIADFSHGIADWLNGIEINQTTLNEISTIASGFANGFDLLGQVVEYVTGVFGTFWDTIEPVRNEFGQFLLDVAQGITDFNSALRGEDRIDDSGFSKRFLRQSGILEDINENTEALSRFQTILTGFNSVASIAGQGVNFLKDCFDKLVEAFRPLVGDLGDKLLTTFANAAEKITEFDKSLKEGTTLQDAAENVGKVFERISGALQIVVDTISTLINSVITGDFSQFDGLLSKIESHGGKLESFGQIVATAFGAIVKVISEAFPVLGGWLDALGTGVGGVLSGLGEALSTFNLDKLVELLQTGALLNLIDFLKQLTTTTTAVSDNMNILKSFFKGLSTDIKTFLTALTKTASASQVLLMAVAIAILAEGLTKLSGVDTAGLVRGATAIAALTSVVFGLFKAIQKLDDARSISFIADPKNGIFTLFTGQSSSMKQLTKILIPFAASILILAFAMEKLGKLNYDELVRGGVGLGLLIFSLTTALKKLNGVKVETSMTKMIGLGIAVRVLVSSVKAIAKLNPQQALQGILAVGALLLELVGFSKLMENIKTPNTGKFIALSIALAILAGALAWLSILDPQGLLRGMVAIGAVLLEFAGFSYLMSKIEKGFKAGSFVVLAIAIGMLAGVMALLSVLDAQGLLRSVVAIGAVLAVIAGLSRYMANTKGLMKTATSMLLFAVAIDLIALAIAGVAMIDGNELLKSLLFIGTALAIVAIFMTGMAQPKVLVGAAAMVIAAAALTVLAVAMKIASTIPWQGLAVAIAGFVATLAILGVASNLLFPLVPAMLGVAGALALMGVALLAAGAGALFFSLAGPTVATAILAVGAAIVGVIALVLSQLPGFVYMFKDTLVAIFQLVIETAPKLQEATYAVIQAILDVLIQALPKFGEFLTALLQTIVNVLRDGVGPVIELLYEALIQGLEMVLNLLLTYIPRFVSVALQLITAIFETIAAHIGYITALALQIIENFILGIAAGIGGVIDAAFKLIIAFINGLADAIRGNYAAIAAAVWNLITAIGEAVFAGLGTVADFGKSILSSILGGILSLLNLVGEVAGNVMHVLMDGLKSFIQSVFNIGGDIVQGFIDGIVHFGQGIWNGVCGVFEGFLNNVKGLFGIASPSTVLAEIGQYLDEGLVQGINDGLPEVEGASEDLGLSALSGVEGIDGTESGENLVSTVLGGFGSSSNEATGAGEEYGTNFASGVDSDTSRAAVQNAVVSLTSFANEAINQNVASYQEAGMSIGTAFAQGISESGDKVSTAINQLSSFSVAPLTKNLNTFTVVGTQYGNGFATKLEATKGRTQAAALLVGTSAETGIKRSVDKLKKIGTSAGEAFMNGMISVRNRVYNAGVDLGNQAGAGINAGVSNTNFWNIGYYAAQGFANGLGSSASKYLVQRSAQALATTAKNQINSTLGIASPSKVFYESGMWSVIGLANGLRDNTKLAASQASKTATAVGDAMNNSLMAMSIDLDEDLFDDPIITPVVDMSHIYESQAIIMDMFERSLSMSADLTASQANAVHATTRSSIMAANVPKQETKEAPDIHYELTQNNYSPKALSRIDLYRQTKNLFGRVARPEVLYAQASARTE